MSTVAPASTIPPAAAQNIPEHSKKSLKEILNTRTALGALSILSFEFAFFFATSITGMAGLTLSPIVTALVTVTLLAVGSMSAISFLFWNNLPPWFSTSPNHLNTLSSIFSRIVVAATSILSFWIAGLAIAGTWTFSATWVVPTIITTGIVLGCVTLFCAIYWNKIPSWLSRSKPSSSNESVSNDNSVPIFTIDTTTRHTESSSNLAARVIPVATNTTHQSSSQESLASRSNEATSTQSSSATPYSPTATSVPVSSTMPISNSSLPVAQSSTSGLSTSDSRPTTLPEAPTAQTAEAGWTSSWPYYYEHSDFLGLTKTLYPAAPPNHVQGPLNIVEFYERGDIPIAQDPNRPNFHGSHGITLNLILEGFNGTPGDYKSNFSLAFVKRDFSLSSNLFSRQPLPTDKLFYITPILFPINRAPNFIVNQYDQHDQLVPVLDEATMRTFRESQHLKSQVLKVLARYLQKFHFTQSSNPLTITATPQFKGLSLKSYAPQIIESLYLLGLEEVGHAFFTALEKIYVSERANPNFDENASLIHEETYQSLLAIVPAE